jgi:hypothetical protein
MREKKRRGVLKEKPTTSCRARRIAMGTCLANVAVAARDLVALLALQRLGAVGWDFPGEGEAPRERARGERGRRELSLLSLSPPPPSLDARPSPTTRRPLRPNNAHLGRCRRHHSSPASPDLGRTCAFGWSAGGASGFPPLALSLSPYLAIRRRRSPTLTQPTTLPINPTPTAPREHARPGRGPPQLAARLQGARAPQRHAPRRLRL